MTGSSGTGRFRFLVLLALATLGACARPDQDRPEAAGQLSAQWLVGGWVLKGSACQSDGGVIYRADGSWYADGASGTWRIERGGLVYLIREQEDELGRRVRNDPPVRHVERIQIVNANEYVASRPDGVVRRLVRCGS